MRENILSDFASNREKMRDGCNCDGPWRYTGVFLRAVLVVMGAVLQSYHSLANGCTKMSVGRYCVET